ncbi:MAG: ABC-F family ATP-binding cassette domain-containing protein [Bdellovibrionota bacterium]
MLQVSGLSKSYGTQSLFEDATFTVNSRERVGLVGRNGHGKSTLFKLLLQQEEYDTGNIATPKDYKIGHLSQQIKFTKSTVLAEGCTGLPVREDGWEETHKVEAVLDGLGFPEEWLQLDPTMLSGGYQVRLNLAKLLVSECDLLLLDEPTNYLDIVSLRWLARFLNSWQGELIIITHNRSFMDQVTTHTMGIHRKKIKKIKGDTQKFYDLLAEEEEHYEKHRQNQLKKREKAEVFISRFRSKASKATQVQSRIKALEKEGSLDALETIKNLAFQFRYKDFPSKRILTLKSAEFGYTESEKLISNLGFEVNRSDRIAIIGKNGKGKTTLLKIIAGELNLEQGSCSLSQHAEVAYFGQTNVDRLNPNKTVEEEILDVQPEHNRTAARTMCGHMMFEGDSALKKVEVLSGGEKSRVLLGKILVSPANLLLLDEPTNHLDMQSSEAFAEALADFPGAILLVTHDEDLLREAATSLIIFDRGKTSFFNGTYDEFLEKVGWEDEDKLYNKKVSKAKSTNKKELRKQRAAAQKMRKEVLEPIKSSMKALEKEIAETEEILKEQNHQLLEGTKNGYCDEMAKLNRSIHLNKEKCDELYEKLEVLMAELEVKEQELGEL